MNPRHPTFWDKVKIPIGEIVASFRIGAVLFVSSFLLNGCLWICRVPFPMEKKYSDDGSCTNSVWCSMITEVRNKSDQLHCYYPTIKMRAIVTKEMCKPIDYALTGEELHGEKIRKTFGWIPLALIWLTSPIDAIVDTVMIPYDIMYFMGNGK